MRTTSLGLVGLLLLAGCSSTSTGSTTAPATQRAATSAPSAAQPDGDSSDVLYPDVIGATATGTGEGIWQFSATLISPYDSPERYADAWRVLASDGTELAVRELIHDHAGEQPFTRSLPGVEVPPGIDVVTIQGRDQVNGWGGATVQVELQS